MQKTGSQMANADRPWQVLARRTAYASDWVSMQLVDLRLPDGQILNDVHLVDYAHEAVAVVPIGEDGRILLIDHYRFQTDTRGWEVPAGRIDTGESAQQAALRELREETGHRTGSLVYLGKYHPSNGSSNQVFHVFVGEQVTKVGEIEDANEVMGLHSFTRAQVIEMIARNEILDGLSLTALCWAAVRGLI